jgi:hypothetical protein
MDIEHLLNPRIEIQTIEDVSDEEIQSSNGCKKSMRRH